MRASAHLLLLLILSGCLASAQAEDFAPGTVTDISVPGFQFPAVVYVPTDYSADKTWPLVLNYHGTNGKPSVSIPRTYTNGEGFIIVGMDFTQRGVAQATEEFYQDEVKALRDTQRLLGEKLSLDPKRLYIGGFSKGGWVSSKLAEGYLPDLAGVYILGAGQFPNSRANKRAANSPSLYIGVGQLEINYPWGVKAIDHFEGLGYEVTFDGYPGLGHRIPMSADASDVFMEQSLSFRQWWEVQRHRTDIAPLRDPVQQWYGALIARVTSGEVEPRDGYLALHRARRYPYYRFLNATQKEELGGLLNKLETHPAAKAEISAQNRFHHLIQGELGTRTFETVHDAALDYYRGYEAHPDTYHGALAGLAAERLRRQLADSKGWRVDNPSTQARMDKLLADEPIPEVPQQPLLDLLRATEEAIRLSL